MTNIQHFLSKCKGVKPLGPNKYQALCPAHDDHNPSLSVTVLNGKTLIHCHAGCDYYEILKALGIDPNNKVYSDDKTEYYDYQDEQGNLVYQAIRRYPKSFSYRRPDPINPDKWINNLNGVERSLYHLPQVIEAVQKGETIYIVEGEKDADNLISHFKLTATCNPFGVGKWKSDYSTYLKDADIVIIPDNDEVGKNHALDVAKSLNDIARSIKIFPPPGLKEKQDITDWLNQGHTREEFLNLIEDTQYQNEIEVTTPLNKIEEYLRKHYEFRFNKVLHKVEVRSSHNDYKELDEYFRNSLIRELESNDIIASKIKLDTMFHSDFSTQYHPFKEYFNSLPKWNETTDYFQELSRTVYTTDSEYLIWTLKKWLVSVVACSIDNDPNESILILVGEQGIGKTRWLNKLIPDSLSKYFYPGIIDPKNKDTFIQLAECFLINLDEIEHMGSNQLKRLKEITTMPTIRVRIPYDRNASVLKRHASFMGSVNSKEFLTDITGSRRFLCHEALSVDHTHTIDMDKVFAQAFHLYQYTDFKYYFDLDEIARIHAFNSYFQERSSDEELILKYFEVAVHGEEEAKLSATDIITYINNKEGMKIPVQRSNIIGKTLTALGFEKSRYGNGYGYLVRYTIVEDQNHSLDPDVT